MKGRVAILAIALSTMACAQKVDAAGRMSTSRLMAIS